MQTAIRYLCVSGTHPGPAAERSRIFCINAIAAADRYLTGIMWRLRVCGPWYRTATCWSTWTLGSEKHTSSMLGVEIICFEIKGYTTPLFSINKCDGTEWPLQIKSAAMMEAAAAAAAYKLRVPNGLVVLNCWAIWSHILSNLFWRSVWAKFNFCLYFELEVQFFCFRGSSSSESLLWVSDSQDGKTCTFSIKLSLTDFMQTDTREKQGRVVVISLTPAGLSNYYACQCADPGFTSTLGYPYTMHHHYQDVSFWHLFLVPVC